MCIYFKPQDYKGFYEVQTPYLLLFVEDKNPE